MRKKFIQVDQSGAEAIIVAYCCPPGNYRQLFINGIKPHSFLAMHLFADKWSIKMREHNVIGPESDFDINELIATPIPELKGHKWWSDLDKLIKSSDDWPVDQRYYFIAKQAEHSSNYDAGANAFRMNALEKSDGKVVIEKEDAIRFLEMKFSLFPEIRHEYHRWVRFQVEENKLLFNLHGHPYQITHYETAGNPYPWKEFYAWIPQSTVGEITNIAYTRMYQFISAARKDWDLLANTHDSYLLQCPPQEEVECAIKAREFMEQEFTSPIDGVKFRMKSEATSGYNWGSYKPGKNEEGLKPVIFPK